MDVLSIFSQAGKWRNSGVIYGLYQPRYGARSARAGRQRLFQRIMDAWAVRIALTAWTLTWIWICGRLGRHGLEVAEQVASVMLADLHAVVYKSELHVRM